MAGLPGSAYTDDRLAHEGEDGHAAAQPGADRTGADRTYERSGTPGACRRGVQGMATGQTVATSSTNRGRRGPLSTQLRREAHEVSPSCRRNTGARELLPLNCARTTCSGTMRAARIVGSDTEPVCLRHAFDQLLGKCVRCARDWCGSRLHPGKVQNSPGARLRRHILNDARKFFREDRPTVIDRAYSAIGWAGAFATWANTLVFFPPALATAVVVKAITYPWLARPAGDRLRCARAIAHGRSRDKEHEPRSPSHPATVAIVLVRQWPNRRVDCQQGSAA